jgi:hypothetical protein
MNKVRFPYGNADYYRLITDSHAQAEIQAYAHTVGNIISELFPRAWKCLCEHAK